MHNARQTRILLKLGFQPTWSRHTPGIDIDEVEWQVLEAGRHKREAEEKRQKKMLIKDAETKLGITIKGGKTFVQRYRAAKQINNFIKQSGATMEIDEELINDF